MTKPVESLNPYVMFGHSGLFGDYFDIIHLNDGALTKVVINRENVPPTNGRYFVERLEGANNLLARLHAGYEIQLEHLDHFKPRDGERYVIGFRGLQLRPLRDSLKSRFGIPIDRLIHPAAQISPSASLGEGVIVAAGCVIASCVSIGDYCLVNRATSIGHDCHVEEFANIGPGTHLASGVKVGRASVLGIGVTVIENIVIGAGARVAAGAVVTRNVGDCTMVAGIPAAFVKTLDASDPA